MADVESGPRATRWLFVVAGLAATFVTLMRAVFGASSDLALLERALAGNDIIGVVWVNWHAVTVIFASLAGALFIAARAPRAAAQAIGILATIAFGATGIILLVVSAQQTGSPFTHYPYIPLGITALLAGAAAWRG
jgi:hypothetical protein